MRKLLTLCLTVSFAVLADDHVEDKPKYTPNKAEYYISTFKEGKDMDDMMRWSKEWAKWASAGDAGEAFKEYRASMLVPMYGNNLNAVDFIWVGITPNPEEQYKGNDYWFANGNDLLKKLPVTNNQVIDTWQRTVSETPDGNAGYVVYSDCKLGEDVKMVDFYDAYFTYAEAAKKLGDVAGRKLIWPGAGTRSEWDYDFVQAVFTSTIADYGKNWTNFWQNSEDMPELQALQELGGSCANERTFGIIPVK